MKRTINNAKVFSVTKKGKMRKIYCIICGKYRNFKNPRENTFSKKHYLFPLFAASVPIKNI